MKHSTRKILSVLLTAVMLLGAAAPVFAAGSEGTAVYDLTISAKMGKDLPLTEAAGKIDERFEKEFGAKPGQNAILKFSHTSDWSGKICMKNGDYIFPGANYDYASLSSMMVFSPSDPGEFETDYTVTDGSCVLTGTLSINITDSGSSVKPVSSVSISKTSLSMDTYSSRTLSVSVSPNNASYKVEWESSNTSVVTADSSTATVTVRSKGKEGSATVTATVTDRSSGKVFTKSCSVTVETEETPSGGKTGSYNPSLTVTSGSDYTGTGISDSIYSEFYKRYDRYLSDNAAVQLSGLNTTYGKLFLSNGSKVSEAVNYTFDQFRNMSFEPYKTGTWTGKYSVVYGGNTLSGTMSIYVNGSSLSVELSHSSVTLAPYSSQYLTATVTPNSSYKIAWSSDDTKLVTVEGSGNAVTIRTTGKTGTTKVRATVTDKSGIQTVKTCSVTVSNAKNNTYDPSMSTYIGNTTAGTTIYDSLKSQFRSVYGVNLPDTAEIRFTGAGDSKIAIRKLENGTPVEKNKKYTMAQYKAMYTDPVSAGAFAVPYSVTYKNNELSGNITIYVNPAPVNVGIALSDSSVYTFRQPLDGVSGGAKLCGAVNGVLNDAKEAVWGYVRITSPAGSAGTLYLDEARTPIKDTTNITPAMMDSLTFVPNQYGTYTADLTAYNDGGKVVAMGRLYITVPGSAPSNPAGLKVQPTTQTIKVNGETVDPEAYNINGMNYFKLRAIAYLLDNTTSQFSVDYDFDTRAISIVTGAPYEELGTEMQKGPDMSAKCVYSTIEVYVNGCAMNLTSYNIGGSTYFQLAELGNVLGFNVGYDAQTRTVLIDSK